MAKSKTSKVTSTNTSVQPEADQAQPTPLLRVVCGKQEFAFTNVEQFCGNEAQVEVRLACENTKEVPQISVQDLLSWTDKQRGALFGLIKGLQRPYKISLKDGGAVCDDLYAAALGIVEGSQDSTRFERGVQTALEAAAICCPSNPMDAAKRIRERFKELGATLELPQVLAKKIKALAADTGENESDDPRVLAERYLADLRAQSDAKEDEAPLRYFQGDFFRWNGRVWRRMQDDLLQAEITKFLQSVEGIKVTVKRVKDVFANLWGLCVVSEWGEPLPLWIDDESGDTKPSPYMAFDNGRVDLAALLQGKEAGEDLSLDPRHFSPIILPYTYDGSAKCPQWLLVMERILRREEADDHRIEVLQEALGWCLLTGNLSINLENFFILTGSGANGKSTVCRVIQEMLGNENVSHVTLDEFDGDYGLFQTADKLANISFDMNRPERIAEGKLKAFVSGEPLQVNRKYKDPCTLWPTAKLFFATNELPGFSDKSDGLWRRATIIPFNVRIPEPERDLQLREKLRAELPGIFNWAVEGARRLIAHKRLTRCSVCERANEEHRLANDHVLSFVRHCLEWTVPNQSRRDLCGIDSYDIYAYYCEHYVHGKPLNRPNFEKRYDDIKEAEQAKLHPELDGKGTPSFQPNHTWWNYHDRLAQT